MRFGVEYDLSVTMNYPLGESSDLAYDNWAKDVLDKANGLGALKYRMVRTGPQMVLSRRLRAIHRWDIPNALNSMLLPIQSQAPDIIDIRIEEVYPERVRRSHPCETIPMEEAL